MILTSSLPLIFCLIGQAPPSPAHPEESAGRLDFMKKSLAAYDVHSTDERATRYRLQPDPIFRFTNPLGGGFGALFSWLDEDDRPVVMVKVYHNREGNWGHEFIALATRPLIANSRSGPDWTPSRDGLVFKPVPEAPKPAATAVLRLLQMRDMTRDFAAEDDFRKRGWSAIRLLSKPLSRYGRPGSDLIDGAIFGFVLATDPQVLLILEVRSGSDGPEWQYAFARLTTFAVKGSWKGREVWNLPPCFGLARDTNQTFHIRSVQRGE